MFDIAPTELLLVAIVALVFIGPKDLPRAMRFVGKWIGRARVVTRQFRSGLDQMVREAELAEMEKTWAAENERIMREHPRTEPLPSPMASPQVIEHAVHPAHAPESLPAAPEPLPEPAAEPHSEGAIDDGEAPPVMVPQPEIRPKPRVSPPETAPESGEAPELPLDPPSAPESPDNSRPLP